MKCPNCDSENIGWEDPSENRNNRVHNRRHPHNPIVGMVAPHWRECMDCGCQFRQEKDGTVRYSSLWEEVREQSEFLGKRIKELEVKEAWSKKVE